MNMNVSLTDELGELVQAKVSRGRYASVSEVVREALRTMEQTEEARLTSLREAWAEGEVPRRPLPRRKQTSGGRLAATDF